MSKHHAMPTVEMFGVDVPVNLATQADWGVVEVPGLHMWVVTIKLPHNEEVMGCNFAAIGDNDALHEHFSMAQAKARRQLNAYMKAQG